MTGGYGGAVGDARKRQAGLEQELAVSESEREDLDTGVDTMLGENVDLARQLEDLRGRIARVTAMVDAEVVDAIEHRVRAAVGDVRCIDCNLRHEERQEYGCHESGRGHTYDTGDLKATEEIERSTPVEYVTLPVADLRAALTGEETDRD